jgi:hypothetical protein
MTVLSAICGLFACVLGAYTMFYDTTNPTQSTAGMFTYVDPVVPPFDYWRAMLGFCDWSSWWFDVPFTSFLYCTFPFVPYAYVWFYPTVEEEVRFAVTTVPLVEMTVLLLAVLVAILVVVNTRPRSRSPSRICVDGVEGVDAGQPKMDLAVSRGPTDFVTDISFAGVNYRDPADFANFNIFEAWRRSQSANGRGSPTVSLRFHRRSPVRILLQSEINLNSYSDVGSGAPSSALQLEAATPQLPVMQLEAATTPQLPVMQLEAATTPQLQVMQLEAATPQLPVMQLEAATPQLPVMQLEAATPPPPVMQLEVATRGWGVWDGSGLLSATPPLPVMQLEAATPPPPVMRIPATPPPPVMRIPATRQYEVVSLQSSEVVRMQSSELARLQLASEVARLQLAREHAMRVYTASL